MAQLIKNENSLFHHNNGVKFTCVTAFATVIALFQIHLRNRNDSWNRLINRGFQKDMGVRLFNIAIEKLNMIQTQCKIDCDRCFPGSTLAAGYREYQLNLL